MVPAAVGLLTLNGLAIAQELRGGVTSFAEQSAIAASVLTTAFYVLLVAVYLRRAPAKATDSSRLGAAAAITASWLPFSIPLLDGGTSAPSVLVVANAMILAGLLWSVVSLRTLDRSFSILPQARALVEHGPYRFVRHPLYLGELVAIAGIALARFSIPAAMAVVVLAVLQGVRIVREEAVLEATLPEYAAYRARTARLVPGVF